MKKIAFGLLVVVFGLFVMRSDISYILMGRLLEDRLAAAATLQLEDGLYVGLCGAGSPLADPERSQPCTVVFAGDKMFLFDVGSSINIGLMGFGPGDIDGIFLTHYHSDHIGMLGEVMMQRWVGGNNTQPLPVYGPEGIQQIVDGFNMAYALDSGYRTAHHGEPIAPTSGKGGSAHRFDVTGEELLEVYNDGSVKISAFTVHHDPIVPAVGYRIDYKGRSAVISGDTISSENLARHAKGVDLLVHEGLSMELVELAEKSATNAGQAGMAKIFFDIRDYHTAPVDVAKLAQQANVKYLAFNHVVPMLPLPGMEDIFLGDSHDFFDGPIRIGKDGDFFSMPANSDAIHYENRL